MSTLASLPVLMYHYVSKFTGPINVSPEHFEQHCKGMAEHGWRGISLPEAEAYLLGQSPLPPRSVLITFDDGFLDNAVYAAPILERYGHQGVVFAVTRRIEPCGACRPTTRDVWNGRIGTDGLPPVDAPLARHALGYDFRNDLFMNWNEARELEQRRIVDIAAHTARHLAVFAGPEFPDRPAHTTSSACFDQAAARFHIPGRRGNTFYHLEGDVPWGMPRFAEQPAMAGPAFIPSEELVQKIRVLVPQDKAGAHAFFQHPDTVNALHDLVDAFQTEELGTVEPETAQRERIRTELAQCRHTLENELGHPVRSLCWPWGRGSDIAREEARSLGFSVFFATAPGANPPGSAPAVRRFKVRDRSWAWLRLRLEIYSRPWAAKAYALFRG